MKTYMPLNGLRWSRNSGSANCDMPQSAVFGRPGGVYGCIPARGKYFLQDITIYEASCIMCHLAVCQLLIMNANLADSAVNPC